MKARILFAFSVFSIVLVSGCSNPLSSKKTDINIMSGSFNDLPTHSAADDSKTSNGSIKKISDSQPQESKVTLTQKETKQTILVKLSQIGAGMVSECEYKSKLYFSVDFNNLSMPTKIVDQRGSIIATCDYQVESKYKLTPICDNLQRCKLVYVSENNVRGYAPVDKYGIINNE